MKTGQVSARLVRLGTIAVMAIGTVGLTGAPAAVGSAASGTTTPKVVFAGNVDPKIYVGNANGNTITSYPLPANENLPPSTTNASSTLNGPYGEIFDANGNLWVANCGDTLNEFTPTQLAAGGSSGPAVVISATSDSLECPVGLGDLWVSNYDSDTLDMYTPSKLAATGAPAPAATITNPVIHHPENIALDPNGNLWVTNKGGDTLLEFTSSQLAAGGTPTPAVTISGPSLNFPQGILFDAAGDAWVTTDPSSGTGSLLEFTPSQQGVSGAPTPVVTVGDDGSTTSINDPYNMEFDWNGALWIANCGANSVSAYDSAQLAVSGNPAPVLKLIGPDSGLNCSAGLALSTPPEAPRGVTAALSGNNITVSWNPLPGPVLPTDYEVTPIVNGAAQPTIDTESTTPTFSYGQRGVGSVSFAVTASNVFGTGPSSALSNAVAMAPGYWLAASDGGIFADGSAGFHGSLGNIKLNKPIVGMAATPSGQGYWLVASDGGVFTEGDATFYGSLGGTVLNKPIVGIAATPNGKGYWLVASDGGIFAFGDANFYGSLGNIVINKPIVGMASTPDGGGYWLVASDGGVFTRGDAGFYGSLGNLVLNKPIVGMASTPDGGGYWLVASDGGVFAEGNAGFYGSLGNLVLNKPIVGMASTPDGGGYWLVASDGGVFAEGDATFGGSQGGTVLNKPIVGMAG
jgi:hypothetical protein